MPMSPLRIRDVTQASTTSSPYRQQGNWHSRAKPDLPGVLGQSTRSASGLVAGNMSIKRIKAIDSHTAGEPTRIVIDGLPDIPGASMMEKKEYLKDHLDHLRRALMLEPRGHENMFGAIKMPVTRPEADLGIIFMDGGGYLNMCGHSTIGFCSAAIETGMIEAQEPVTDVVLEAPAGIIRARARVENGKAKSVSFRNVPSFLYKDRCRLKLPGVGRVRFDIAFGGSFFCIVECRELNVDIEPGRIRDIVDKCLTLRNLVNREIEIVHPDLPHIREVDLVEVCGPAKSGDAHMQNVVVFGSGQVDRSPCGTGTSAKLACLYHRGEIALNEEFVNESVLGTKFVGKVIKETAVGEFKAIVPEITGSAHITGFNEFVMDETDPVKYGFVLG
jgi:proline racemase